MKFCRLTIKFDVRLTTILSLLLLIASIINIVDEITDTDTILTVECLVIALVKKFIHKLINFISSNFPNRQQFISLAVSYCCFASVLISYCTWSFAMETLTLQRRLQLPKVDYIDVEFLFYAWCFICWLFMLISNCFFNYICHHIDLTSNYCQFYWAPVMFLVVFHTFLYFI